MPTDSFSAKLLAGEGRTRLVTAFHNRRLSVNGAAQGHFLFIAFGCLIYDLMLVLKLKFVKQYLKFRNLAQMAAQN